jgi:leucyl-tRNA synthetase
MKGFNVLFPMGFDAFGLPAENAAIQRGIHPAKWTYANIERMRKQMRSMGAMFDWAREAVSSDPAYYKWTEWFFERFFEADLAYRGEALVNWSPTLQTVLANEQVIDGKDERTGQPVIQKMMTQWFFRYKAYADEMLDFSKVDWPEPIKIMQTNWIGRSEGARVVFKTEGGDPIEIYTTRPDTLWGATFMVLSPEHPLVDKITTDAQRKEVTAYREAAAKATEIERTAEDREKTGVWTGAYAINPVNGEKIQIWIADYVMITYGTGAIMAVPYGDQRDFEFARKFDLPIVAVVKPDGADAIPDPDQMDVAYAGPGEMVNSGPINGVYHNGQKGRKSEAIAATIDYLMEKAIGEEAVNYRLRDWLISRQRYWGSPIPMIHTARGTFETVPTDDLPVLLPQDVEMTGFGNPLAMHEEFVHTTDSQGEPARRETDTMDTFMCSSWYWYRYLSPSYDVGPFDPEEAAYWLPVDTYTGGAEHATMHLLYARWFAKAMRDLGMFEDAMEIMKQHGRDPESMTYGEPMMLLRNQGQVLGAERPGDYILATGRKDGQKLFADHVQVVDGPSAVPAGFDGVFGEIVKRTENVLQVDMAGVNHVVEVVADAQIDISTIPGENTVSQLRHHLDVQRMSKSKGNVINPDELVAKYGADTVRAYLMFGFDWEKGGPWNPDQISGPERWIRDVWDLATSGAPTDDAGDDDANRDLARKVHQAIAAVSHSIERFSFNTAVSALMTLRNQLQAFVKAGTVGKDAWSDAINVMLRLMAPITPHVAEELWARSGFAYSIHTQPWPEYDEDIAREDTVTLVIMVNGKPRGEAQVSPDVGEKEAVEVALASEAAVRFMNGGKPRKIIFIAARSGQEPKVNIVL